MTYWSPPDVDLPGLWMPVAATTPAQTAFDTNAPPPQETALWQLELTSDPDTARRELDARVRQLDWLDQGLDIARARLVKFSQLVEHQPGAASFGVSTTGETFSRPEGELQLWLLEVGGQVLPSFGLADALSTRWNQVVPEFQTFVERLVQAVVYYARVETSMAGQPVARTIVSWTGDLDTAWRAGTGPEQAALHQRTLALALASRNAFMRALTLASRGAVLLASLPALLATPGGALVALPAAWKFIQQVLCELEQSQNDPGELHGAQ